MPVPTKNEQVVIYPTEDEVALQVATHVAYFSDKIISEKGSFSVVLSGGTLINSLRNYGLVEMVNILVDERVVPLDDPESNYLLALNGFLSKVPIPKENIYPINYSPSAETVAQDYEAQLRKLVADKVLPLSATGFPQFDLMLLGVGPDGHVASLFPNRPQRYNKKDWVTFIEDSPKPPPKRITFTFPVINSATCIAMVVTDEEEADAVYITLEHKPHLPPLPCSEVKAQLNLSWFLNWDAASKLPSSTNKK
ncbi:putative 6-phosphogluconolactonase 4, chloroplastic [Sesamum angolense]|uniref:Probable 6-phosphogluconolactonase n=1 Tax=Sesamum angolense TaxID=2727404 RepID=A0AAE1W0S5_9LAMI|nr:putative 6-phosphogluconolactonase 4, chloroplastic [Sesamum angolense]